jgi:ribosomal protein L11
LIDKKIQQMMYEPPTSNQIIKKHKIDSRHNAKAKTFFLFLAEAKIAVGH